MPNTQPQTHLRHANKTAIVTGGGSGIGKAISLRLAEEGASLIILEIAEEAGESTATHIREKGGSAKFIPCNVANTQSVRDAFSQIPKIDILVNSAGIAHVGNIEQTSPEDLDRIYVVNVKGVYHCLHFALPAMLKKGGGTILNIASIAAKVGISDRFAYSMSKGAVLSMTLSIARDYVEKGIRCNCLCPARIHTPFVDGYLEKNYPAEKEVMLEKLSKYQPLGRMGTPEEVAALAAFLCSEEAAFITGTAYDIDGGVTLLR